MPADDVPAAALYSAGEIKASTQSELLRIEQGADDAKAALIYLLRIWNKYFTRQSHLFYYSDATKAWGCTSDSTRISLFAHLFVRDGDLYLLITPIREGNAKVFNRWEYMNFPSCVNDFVRGVNATMISDDYINWQFLGQSLCRLSPADGIPDTLDESDWENRP